jgi:hypothetical protein
MQFDRQCRKFEEFDYVFRVGDIWLPAKLLLLGGVVKFFKPKHKDKLKEAN